MMFKSMWRYSNPNSKLYSTSILDDDDDDDDRFFASLRSYGLKIPFILRHRKIVEVKEENLAAKMEMSFFAREVIKRFSNKLKEQQQHQNLKTDT